MTATSPCTQAEGNFYWRHETQGLSPTWGTLVAEKGPAFIHGHSCLSKHAYHKPDTGKALGVELGTIQNKVAPSMAWHSIERN